jgi:hypothetical protein
MPSNSPELLPFDPERDSAFLKANERFVERLREQQRMSAQATEDITALKLDVAVAKSFLMRSGVSEEEWQKAVEALRPRT